MCYFFARNTQVLDQLSFLRLYKYPFPILSLTMPSTPQTQSFNRKSLTVFMKCDELAKLEGTEVTIFMRRKNQISIYQFHDFWLSKDDKVSISYTFPESELMLQNCAYPLPRRIQPQDLRERSERRKRRKNATRRKLQTAEESRMAAAKQNINLKEIKVSNGAST